MHQFSGVTELVHDSLGHSDCLGSGYVMRRAALEEIGGFPVESLSEDVCCSAKLLGAGWKTCFIPESLQHGSVPESYNAHVKQRTRWVSPHGIFCNSVAGANTFKFVGHVQTAMMFKLRLFGEIGRHLNWRQRLVGISFDLKHLIQAPLGLVYLALPFTMLAGYPFVLWSDMGQLKILIRLVSVHMLCRWSHQVLLAVIARRVNYQFDVRLPSYDTDLEQFISPCELLAPIFSLLGKKTDNAQTCLLHTFDHSSYLQSSVVERQASLPLAVLLPQWMSGRKRREHLCLVVFGLSFFISWHGCIYYSLWQLWQAWYSLSSAASYLTVWKRYAVPTSSAQQLPPTISSFT